MISSTNTLVKKGNSNPIKNSNKFSLFYIRIFLSFFHIFSFLFTSAVPSALVWVPSFFSGSLRTHTHITHTNTTPKSPRNITWQQGKQYEIQNKAACHHNHKSICHKKVCVSNICWALMIKNIFDDDKNCIIYV